MHARLTNLDYLQSLLHKNGIRPVRSAGQSFLVCEEPVQVTLSALEGGPKKVTELGAGIGPLTQALLALRYKVRAIERDKKLAKLLSTVLPKQQQANLDLQVGDLRAIHWDWADSYQIVGNIPYNLSGYIFRRLVNLNPAPTRAVFMVQRELGSRLCAEPPEMSLLSLTVQLWGTAHGLLRVPQTCFWPSPKVESAVVMLTPHAAAGNRQEKEDIMRAAKIFFQQKRKQVRGVLLKQFHLLPEEAERTLLDIGATATARPQELSVAQWRALYIKTRNWNNREYRRN